MLSIVGGDKSAEYIEFVALGRAWNRIAQQERRGTTLGGLVVGCSADWFEGVFHRSFLRQFF